MTTPSGYFSLAVDGIRQMLANSTAFQAWIGTTDAAVALEHIYITRPDAEGDYPEGETKAGLWPFVVLNLGRNSYRLGSTGPLPLFAPEQMVKVYFEEYIDTSLRNQTESPKLAFLNSMGAILEELMADSQGDGGLQILGIDTDEPGRVTNSTLGGPGDFYAMEWTISTGFR